MGNRVSRYFPKGGVFSPRLLSFSLLSKVCYSEALLFVPFIQKLFCLYRLAYTSFCALSSYNGILLKLADKCITVIGEEKAFDGNIAAILVVQTI